MNFLLEFSAIFLPLATDYCLVMAPKVAASNWNEALAIYQGYI